MKGYKKTVYIILGTIVAACIVGISEKSTVTNQMERRNPGDGDYQEEWELDIEGLVEGYSYQVLVPEQKLTKQQEQDYLQAALQEIEMNFPGENKNFNEIREMVQIEESYQNGLVRAEWGFDNYEIISFEGDIVAEEISEEGELVTASVELQCGTSKILQEFSFRVYPKQLTPQEEVANLIQRYFHQQESEAGQEYVTLPEKAGDYKLSWKKKSTHTPIKILFFGGIVAGLLPLVERSRRQEAVKRREQKLALEYSDLVSKLSILLSAGMTMQGAWKKIAFLYCDKRKKNTISEMPAYEEMMISCHEMESGLGEERVYQRFGKRCNQGRYRKLGNLLSQNLRKGSRGIVALLEQETKDSFTERKQAARRYGEEAATKLLLPMLLLFGMILILLIVPALTAFQI